MQVKLTTSGSLVALVATVTLLTLSQPKAAHCSSYLDDYFLPTAKMALNKLQQTLSPSLPRTSEQIDLNAAGGNGSGGGGDSLAPSNRMPQQDLPSQVTNIVPLSSSESPPATTTQTLATINPSSTVIEEVTTKIKNNQDKNQDQQAASEAREPDRSEFVMVDSTSDNSQLNQQQQQQQQQQQTQMSSKNTNQDSPTEGLITVASVTPELVTQEAAVTVVSSTQATEVDPTTSASRVNEETTSMATMTESAELNTIPTDEMQPKLMEQEPAVAVAAPVPSAEEPVIVPVDSGNKPNKSPEELAKEAEFEAIAAVEASIGFGQLGKNDPFGSMSDSCYDEYGNARFCEPEFENVAFERQVFASSECGSPASRFCTAHPTERNNRNCHVCDQHHPKKRHPSSYLTDLNNSNAPTCWVSAPMDSAGALNQSTATTTSGGNLRADNVTLELNLDKKYEITYISMQFCSPKPDSLAIFKSGDLGQTWTPYQYYSSQCRRLYGRQAASGRGLESPTILTPAPATTTTSGSSAPEATCQDASQSGPAGRVAFSTLDGRQAGQGQLERSPILQDWVTATNIKVVLDRHQAAWIQANQLAPHQHRNLQSLSSLKTGNASQMVAASPVTSTTNQADELATSESSLTNPSDTYNYAMSDLTIGGRCKCNGHASRCIHGPDGRLQCDCRHNTAGRDCEKCAQLHFDRPWARATQLDANPCQPCNCNGHTRKCRFDPELYQLSGRRSGGVCIQCKDNTAGRHCHYCKEGFTRDHSKPMSDREACKPCNCHPVGSLGRACNQTTGQCPCKEGVTGLECSRCASGYQQSSSPSEPCIKLPENDINYEPSLAIDGSTTSEGEEQQPGLLVATESPIDTSSVSDDSAPSVAEIGRPPAPASGDRTHLAPDEPVVEVDKRPEERDQDLEADGRLTQVRGRSRAQWSGRNKHNYYSASNRYPNHRRPLDIGEDDNLDLGVENQRRQRLPNADEDTDDDYAYPSRHYPAAFPTPNRDRKFGHEYRRRGNGQRGWQAIGGDPTIANLEPGNYNTDPSDDQLNSGRGYPPAESIYHQDTYNSIQSPSLRRNHHHSFSASRMHRPAIQQQPSVPVLSTNSISCGDCQSNTRRLGRRQFCHLDYAIKASTLRRQVSDDWTKFDIEIEDIFKSPASSVMRAATAPSDDIDNLLQADEPTEAPSRSAFNSATSATNKTLEDAQQVAPQTHRFKVGTVQTIWIPTEDISCKCPKLKPGFTYLLMGSVDSRDDSPNSIQLDRHGVALEWKPSFLGKLAKYRLRHEKGRC